MLRHDFPSSTKQAHPRLCLRVELCLSVCVYVCAHMFVCVPAHVNSLVCVCVLVDGQKPVGVCACSGVSLSPNAYRCFTDARYISAGRPVNARPPGRWRRAASCALDRGHHMSIRVTIGQQERLIGADRCVCYRMTLKTMFSPWNSDGIPVFFFVCNPPTSRPEEKYEINKSLMH